MKELRQLEELSVADLVEHQVWTWAYDEEQGDELSVIPEKLLEVPIEGEFFVACTVRTRTGVECTAVLSVTDGDLDIENIVVVEASKKHWELGAVPPPRSRASFAHFFGGNYNEIFPIAWRMEIPLVGRGQLEGIFEQKVHLVEVTAQCPFCGGILRTNRARQCPHCLRNWA